MNWLAWKMLTGDRAKYLGIVFGVAFGSLLIAQQSAIFVGLMRRTSSQILDVSEADLWAMDAGQENVDEIRPLPDNRLYQVRGVEGVQWAVQAEEARLRAGSWEADKLISRAAVERARAELAQLRTQADRHTVLAPDPDREGHGANDSEGVQLDVLQLNVRPGEAVASAAGGCAPGARRRQPQACPRRHRRTRHPALPLRRPGRGPVSG